MRGKLAQDGEAQREPKQSTVNGARIRGKLSHLIRGDLPFFENQEKEAGVSRGHSSRWRNDHPGRLVKVSHRAKGQTVRKVSRRKQDTVATDIWRNQIDRGG